MLPYTTYQDRAGNWAVELYDTQHQMWINYGPFDTKEQAELAAVHHLQHE